MRDRRIVLGVAGLGVVGSGLLRVLAENRDWIARRVGAEFVVKTVLVRDPGKPRDATLPDAAQLVVDPALLTEDPEIDVVCELMGGLTTAKDLVSAALKAGKHVVTANKALLAQHGNELFALAEDKGRRLAFEAAAAGAVPVVGALRELLASNRIEKVLGILNGTANFILSEMTNQGLDYEDALKRAQELGFAEADPTLDVEGWDAAHKLVLLIRLAFGVDYPLHKLVVHGVADVQALDIAYARDFGCKIKLIAQARDIDGHLEAGVMPMLVPDSYLLASVEGAFNAVRIDGNACGPIMLYGQGAGSLPTGSAVLADLLNIARGDLEHNLGFVDSELPKARIVDCDEAASRHYLRFMAPDRPGVLRDIGGRMAEHGVSIAQVVQKGEDQGKGVPIVFLTHPAQATEVHAAMSDVNADGLSQGRIVHYRIL